MSKLANPKPVPILWLRHPVPIGLRGRSKIVGVGGDTRNADRVFRRLEREGEKPT